MIARHDTQQQPTTDSWTLLAAPLPTGAIAWRQDGKPIARDGRYVARFVAYIEAHTVRERLDSVVPGEWNLTLEPLPQVDARADALDAQPYAFKARLQILGVVREDVGMGKDYKQAATDAFKRVAVRFGIGHELYALGQNWVPMDGEGKHARPLDDPRAVHDRRQARSDSSGSAAESESDATSARPVLSLDTPPCPKCAGRMWDNRVGKRNPKAPDFKCRDRACDGVVWPSKTEEPSTEKPPDDAAMPF